MSAAFPTKCRWPTRSGGLAATSSCRPRITPSRSIGEPWCRSFTTFPQALRPGAFCTSGWASTGGHRVQTKRGDGRPVSGIFGVVNWVNCFRPRPYSTSAYSVSQSPSSSTIFQWRQCGPDEAAWLIEPRRNANEPESVTRLQARSKFTASGSAGTTKSSR